MKPSLTKPGNKGRHGGRRILAFTLTELLFTIALVSFVFTAVFVCQYYGMQMHAFIKPKLENADFARNTLAQLIEEIRSAETVEVGQGSGGSFVVAGTTNAQAGNAIRIRLAGNTNQSISYYRDVNSETLRKIPLGASNFVTVAKAVTNSTIFRIEDISGVVLTNNQSKSVVDVLLQMRQPAFRSDVSDSYQVRTKITRRAML